MAKADFKKDFGRSKRGSVVILIALLFISLVVAASCIFEAAARRASECTAELAYRTSGRAVLSCYDKELEERFGIFGIECGSDEIATMLRYMTDKSLKEAKISSCKNESLTVEAAEFTLTDPQILMNQIQELMKIEIASDAISQVLDYFRDTDNAVRKKKDIEDNVSSLEAAMDADEEAQNEREASDEDDETDSIDFGEIRRVHNDLKRTAASINSRYEGRSQDNRVLLNKRIINTLPSKLYDSHGIFSVFSPKDDSFKESGSAQSAMLNEYIISHFDNHLDKNVSGDTFFENEVEYILYGNYSDNKNYASVKSTVFALRTALNIAYLYTDASKRKLTHTAAQTLTPGPYAYLTQLLIISAWGALEASNDWMNLENGNAVPLVKTQASWMTDLGSVLGGEIEEGYIPIESSSIMKYPYYLRLLLMTESQKTRLYRIMDLIQIDIKGTVREEFTLSDHYDGFSLRAELSRKSRAFVVPSSRGTISMIHRYIGESADEV